MFQHQYLIVGGGMSADAAVHGIRDVDSSGSIGLISSERHIPYKRPALSKGLWKGEPLESIWLPNAKSHATIYPSRTVTRIVPGDRMVIDDRGDSYSYGKLLLAMGGVPHTLPYHVDGIIYFRTLDDYELLRRLAPKGSSAVVIGGGFTGSEIAAALSMNGVNTTIVFPQEGLGIRMYSKRLSLFLGEFFTAKGVRVLANQSVTDISRQGDTYRLNTSGGLELSAQVVVAGIGIRPNAELARKAGLEVESAIIVNELLQTSDPDIYACGDVASFVNPALEKRVHFEHEDNANVMGECAGKNMAGQRSPYHHLPFFYSDLFKLGYEAIGETDSTLEIVEDWKEEFREGVVYYLRDQKVRGVLLWNTWGQVDHARELISRKSIFTRATVLGQLPRE